MKSEILHKRVNLAFSMANKKKTKTITDVFLFLFLCICLVFFILPQVLLLSVQEALKSLIYPFTTPVTAQQATSENPPGISNPAAVRRVVTSPDTNDLLESLPQKYRRKPVSNEEMEYIQVRHSSFISGL